MPPIAQNKYEMENMSGAVADVSITLARPPHPPLEIFAGSINVGKYGHTSPDRPAGPREIANALGERHGLHGAEVTVTTLPVDAEHPYGGMEVVVRIEYHGLKTARLAFYIHRGDMTCRTLAMLAPALSLISEKIRA